MFNVETKNVGSAILTFDASGGGERDILKVKFPVITPGQYETVTTYGMTEDEAIEKISPPGNVNQKMGGLKVSVASTALQNIDKGIEYLLDYPYGCLEQTVSRILPLIKLRSIISDFSITTLKSKKIDEIIEENLQKIYKFQNYDGGLDTGYRQMLVIRICLLIHCLVESGT